MDGSGIVAIGLLTGLGAILSLVLAVANRRLFVVEDPRIDTVEEMLPGANCGACGMPGCRAFAEAVVAGKAPPSGCSVSSPDGLAAIASFLGVSVGSKEKRVARLACAGGTNVARQRVQYEGLESCRAADLVSGGGKGCAWGCLGLADCEVSCTFDAIKMNQYSLPVVNEDRCTACGDCVRACPRDLFSLHEISHKLWVACKNELLGEPAEAECEVACTGCGRCAMDAPHGLIEIKRNLAIVDYQQNKKATKKPIERCPTGAIVWLGKDGEVTKGAGARKIIRKEPLPIG